MDAPGAVKLSMRGTLAPPRIAVFRALALGDMLCAVPALRALRGTKPDAEITLIGLPWARWFVDRFDGYVDRLLEFPGFPGIPERPVDVAATTLFLQRAQSSPFDLAIQLQGNGIVSNSFVALLGARQTAGFYPPGHPCPDPNLYLEYPGHLPEALRYLALMEFLGAEPRGEELEFPIRESEQLEADRLMAEHGLEPGRFVCVHPGASAPSRRWPPQDFAVVADALAHRGLRVVLTGTEAERPMTAAVSGAMRDEAIDLAGRTELGVLAGLLRHARLVVANDTGISHVAAALRIPSVIVFIASDPDRWAPLDGRLHRAVGELDVNECRHAGGAAHRCLGDACTIVDRSEGPVALLRPRVRAEAVIAAAEEMLATPSLAPSSEPARHRATRPGAQRVETNEAADVA